MCRGIEARMDWPFSALKRAKMRKGNAKSQYCWLYWFWKKRGRLEMRFETGSVVVTYDTRFLNISKVRAWGGLKWFCQPLARAPCRAGRLGGRLCEPGKLGEGVSLWQPQKPETLSQGSTPLLPAPVRRGLRFAGGIRRFFLLLPHPRCRWPRPRGRARSRRPWLRGPW